eukprot:scaffold87417_cov18-Tisochrysis_lutea.AAC.1
MQLWPSEAGVACGAGWEPLRASAGAQLPICSWPALPGLVPFMLTAGSSRGSGLLPLVLGSCCFCVVVHAVVGGEPSLHVASAC